MAEGTSIGTNPIPPQIVSNVTTTATPVTKSPDLAPIEAKQAEVKKQLKLLKVDGTELNLDEEEFTRFAQKGIGAEKRFAEANALRRQIEQQSQELEKRQKEFDAKMGQTGRDDHEALEKLLQQAQGDPQKLLKVREKAERWLIEQIKLEQASPEQQELLRVKQENERLKADNKKSQDEKNQAELNTLTQKHRDSIESTIIKALDISGLPPNEWNVKHMADLMHKAFKGKYELKPEQLAEMVRQDRVANTQSITKDYTEAITNAHKSGDMQKVILLGENLENLMGSGLINALRWYDLAKLKAGQPKMPTKPIETAIPKTPEEQKKAYSMSWDEAEQERKKVVQQLEAEFRRR